MKYYLDLYNAVNAKDTKLAKDIIDKCPENLLGALLAPSNRSSCLHIAAYNRLTDLAKYMIDKCPKNRLGVLLGYDDFQVLWRAMATNKKDFIKHIIDNFTSDNINSFRQNFARAIGDSLLNNENKDILKIILDILSEEQLPKVYSLMLSAHNIYGLEYIASRSMNLIKIDDLSQIEKTEKNLPLIKFYLIFENDDSKRANVVNSITGIDDSQKKVILTEVTKRNELFQKNYNFAEIFYPGNLDVVNFSTLNKKGDFKNLPPEIKGTIASFLNGVSAQKLGIFDAPTVKVASPASNISSAFKFK